MHLVPSGPDRDPNPGETREWTEALEDLIRVVGPARAQFIISSLISKAQRRGLQLPFVVQTPYVNSIPAQDEAPYPGDEKIEKRIRRIVRWNAAAMVIRANHRLEGIGGHLSTYASAATLYEVGFNHFFRGKDARGGGDHIYFQGHSSPGIYARAFLEGRLTEAQLENFRREAGGKGLSSYPHPRLMPDLWEFPTVSMGLGPLAAIYQARFNRYLRDRGIKDTDGQRVWAFLGDGECDEPETLGALSIAARERLDNLCFVVNCNLQRLDGPVRGNGKIIQELEAVFRGSGWNVIKVIWSRAWDPLLAKDTTGLLERRMSEAVDGDYQKYSVEPGAYTREHFFGKYPELASLVQHLTDEQIRGLRRGGHDAVKVHTAYAAAVAHRGAPTAILAKTVKGWALGEGAEGRNATHQQKKLSHEQMMKFRDELELPIPDDRLHDAPFYRPAKGDVVYDYLHERRRKLGGPCPRRVVSVPVEEIPPLTNFGGNLLIGSGEGDASTTRAFGKLLADLLKDEKFGRRVVPIIPDEARTFGLDSLFKRFGIYSSVGQVYEPVDSAMLISYREAKDGQVLEEGICEAGAMATFTASGTSYATHGVTTIPLYIFYSMFGYQRIGDQVWAFGDARGRGFMLGATAGRTTLNGEGLQHQDGHSPLLFSAVPNCRIYDPAWAFELAVIIRDGLKRMYADHEDCFYYITLYNENYAMPPMPEGSEEGILKGLYLFRRAPKVAGAKAKAQIIGSGTILREALRAQELLAKNHKVAADVWSATSYVELRREALAVERWNRLHPDKKARTPYVVGQLAPTEGPIVAVSDYVKAVPDMVGRWLGDRFLPLGTDGYGRSDSRAALRRFFEVDGEHVTAAVLSQLARAGKVPVKEATAAIREYGLDPEAGDPATR